MKVIKWILKNAEIVITVFLLAFMLIMLFAQVVFRAVKLPLAWTEELSMFCLIWLCYFGASAAIIHRRHMRVDILVSHFPQSVQIILAIFANLVFIAFASIVARENFVLMMRYFNGHQLSAAARIPKWIAYAGVPISFALMIIRLIVDSVKRVAELRNLKKPLTEEEGGNE